eukprot:13002621-Alexandrium_andersonii.AAC.1
MCIRDRVKAGARCSPRRRARRMGSAASSEVGRSSPRGPPGTDDRSLQRCRQKTKNASSWKSSGLSGGAEHKA